jgi:hypothetical protein
MLKINRSSLLWLLLSLLLLLFAWLLSTRFSQGEDVLERAKGLRRSGQILNTVVNAPAMVTASSAQGAAGYSGQIRLGFASGDQWEPSIAADRFGHVYVLYPQYLGVPGCPACASPTMILQTSSNRGMTWSAPAVIYPAGNSGGQWDAQIVVDPVDGRTVYAAWLQNGKSDTVVAKSTDFGNNWTAVVADHTNAGTDKPILAVRGQDVYVAYNHAQKIWVSSSHDAGATFTSVALPKTGKLGWALAGGGTVDPAGNVYFGWAGYKQNGGARGPVNLFISKSADGGSSWANTIIDVSGAPPDCSAYLCGWAYLGAQLTVASDAAGTIYALWNAGPVSQDKGPERIYFAKSTNAGVTYTPKVDVSTAAAGVNHAFPAMVAGAAGDVRISWMDARVGPLWNTYTRRSSNSGANWSAEIDISTFVPGFSYIQADGFSFPFGDYYEMDIDDRGTTHVVWGEGLNYDTPGSIWYSKGN